MDTKELLHISYKKLKSNVFFDKTQLPLRDKIVMFEAIEFENILDDLAKEIDEVVLSGKNEFGEMTNHILKGINCYVLPKKLYEEDTVNLKSPYCNYPKKSVKIQDCQYFIDMDVLGHVLGIAWILLLGYAIDDEISENSYGNRLKKNTAFKEQLSNSPYLFESYFSQYESWRDKGLEQAKKLLSNNKNVIMLTLDLSRFYYSVNIERDKLDNIVSKIHEKKQISKDVLPIVWYLTDFIYKVIESYSLKICSIDKSIVEDRNILPIGFAPSNILSNYCLRGFDNAVIEGWNPTYFGRYVDDVLIIDKVEENSTIFNAVKNQEMTTSLVLNYYLISCDVWNKKINVNKGRKKGLIYKIKENSKKDEIKYQINNDFLDFKGCKINLQNRKAKVFYFDSSQSDILIRCFQKNLQKNISEFRYLPEDEPIFKFDDYTEIYKIQEQSGPNKLNGVEDFSLDKFELSKFLGKYMRISSLIDDSKESRFKKDIAKIFTSDVTIKNYTAWEKIFAILINNQYFDETVKFLDVVLKNIALIDCLENKNKPLIQKSLIDILYSALSRTLSLVWGKDLLDFVHGIEKKIILFSIKYDIYIKRDNSLEEYRKQYCKSRMCDKYALPFVIDEVIDKDKLLINDDGDMINLSSFNSFLNYLSKIKNKTYLVDIDNHYKFYPYIVTIMDLTFAHLIDSLINEQPLNINYDSNKLKRVYNDINYFNPDNDSLNRDFYYHNEVLDGDVRSCVKVGSEKFDEIKIAVANTELNDNLLQGVLSNTYDRTYERYDNLVNMVNDSIKNNAKLLVLPEGYLPIEWLPIFTRTCAKNQIAAVVGLEHFIIKNYVFNITATILPYTEDDYNFAYIHFHRKMHYAPQEELEIKSTGRQISEGNELTIYNWNNFWFPVYCCYELSSIKERAVFQSFADAVIAVEWNMDINYYSNIVESLSRDLHCYFIQVNVAKYGDSRITQPTKTEEKDLLRVKGGKNSIVLIDDIKIKALRDFQLSGNFKQKSLKTFKLTPPNFNYDIVQLKKDNKLWSSIKSKQIKLF